MEIDLKWLVYQGSIGFVGAVELGYLAVGREKKVKCVVGVCWSK